MVAPRAGAKRTRRCRHPGTRTWQRPPEDQHIPYFDLDELVQESIYVLPEIGSQLGMLAEEYPTCTDAEGSRSLAWACITAPLPYGRGCDLDALHASVTLLATQLETLKAAAKPPTVTTTKQVTKRPQVLAVLPTLKPPFTAPQVAAATGLPTTEHAGHWRGSPRPRSPSRSVASKASIALPESAEGAAMP